MDQFAPNQLATSHAVLSGGSRNPLPLDDKTCCYRIRRGHFDVFAIRDTILPSRRHHLFRLEEHAILFGIERSSGPHLGLLAVGSLDSELEVCTAGVPLTAAECEPWITALASTIGHPPAVLRARIAAPGRITLDPDHRLLPDARAVLWLNVRSGEGIFGADGPIAGPGAQFPLAGGLALHARDGMIVDASAPHHVSAGDLAFFNVVCRQALQAIVATPEQATSGVASEPSTEGTIEDALSKLARVHGGESPPMAAVSREPLRASLLHLFEALQVAPVATAFAADRQSDASPPERLADLLARHDLMSRQVLLRHEWQASEGPPLLAYRGEGRRPVALVHDGRCWHLLDGDARVRVDETTAAELAPEAMQLYPALPPRPLRFGDLFAFGLAGSALDGWRLAGFMLAASILGAMVPLGSYFLVDKAIPQGDLGLIGMIAAGLLAAVLTRTAFDGVKQLALLRGELRFEGRLQPALLARLLRLPVSIFRAYPVGDIVDRVLGIQQAREILSASAAGSIVATVFSLVSLVPLLMVDYRIALLALGLAIALGCVTATLSYARLRHERRRIAHKGQLDGFALQILMGITKLKASATESVAFARWTALFSTNMTHVTASERWANWQRSAQALLPSIVTMLLYTAILVWMEADAAKPSDLASGAAPGHPPFSAGDFVAVSAGFSQVVGAIAGLAEALTLSMTAIPLIERAKPLISGVPERALPAGGPTRLSGAIDIRNVSFRYTASSPLALSDVSIRIEKGEFVAIVGASGSGKSTLLRLLLGFEKPEQGDVFFDGCSIQRIELSMLRRQVGVVLQNGRLSSGSIYSNIVGQSAAGMDGAMAAARLAGLEEDIAAMPMGMHTVLLDGGATLSGGQRQRLLIARALAGQPAILLLDEATSALDNRTQSVVTDTLSRLAVTRVVIAHRLSTIESVDRIVVLDRGKIAETGNYRELMARNGSFAALARRQLV